LYLLLDMTWEICCSVRMFESMLGGVLSSFMKRISMLIVLSVTQIFSRKIA
jgi:uncharacterized membrane protein